VLAAWLEERIVIAQEILKQRMAVAMAHLKIEIDRLTEASNFDKPFHYGEDVRENHRQRITENIRHWFARIEEIQKLMDA
jgi:hypothetical protein